ASAGENASVRRPLELVPELSCRWVTVAVRVLELLDLGVGIGVAIIELAPGAEPAAEAKSQIVGLAEVAPGLVVGGHGALERLRRHHAVGLVLRVAGLVVLAVGFKLPVFAGQPR